MGLYGKGFLCLFDKYDPTTNLEMCPRKKEEESSAGEEKEGETYEGKDQWKRKGDEWKTQEKETDDQLKPNGVACPRPMTFLSILLALLTITKNLVYLN